METNTPLAPVSKAARVTGWILTVLPCLLLAFSAVMKLAAPPDKLAEGFGKMGIPISHALGLGILELTCTVIYLIPRTAVLGAILLTGYMGGAIQTHIRIGDGIAPHIVVGVLLWGGLYLRDPRLRALIPFRR